MSRCPARQPPRNNILWKAIFSNTQRSQSPEVERDTSLIVQPPPDRTSNNSKIVPPLELSNISRVLSAQDQPHSQFTFRRGEEKSILSTKELDPETRKSSTSYNNLLHKFLPLAEKSSAKESVSNGGANVGQIQQIMGFDYKKVAHPQKMECIQDRDHQYIRFIIHRINQLLQALS